jgi:uncharacterized protein YbjT (DUF2867 family)
MINKTALILGGTGLVGAQLVKELSSGNEYEQIHLLTRREIESKHSNIKVHIVDFDNLPNYADLFKVNDVFVCLGTTIKKAKSKEAFRKVDYDYVVETAKLAKMARIDKFLVITAMGANSKSKFFYSRVKGDVEETLQLLNLNSLHMFRPSLLLGERKELRVGEKFSKAISSFFQFLLIGPLRAYRPIKANTVANAMIVVAKSKLIGNYIYRSNEVERLAREISKTENT